MHQNRDAKKGFKLDTRQRKISGKFPFHRVHKMVNTIRKLVANRKSPK